MKTTHTEFERYYQQVRSRQKRDAVCWSLLLLALYFAPAAAEFNLLTIWHSLPHFFDYMAETIPPLSAGNLFADVQTKGSLAWGYRLPIQLPLIWETLQLALASTRWQSPSPRFSRFLPPITPVPGAGALCHSRAGGVLRTMPELAWAVIFVMAFGIGAIPGFLALMLHTVGSLTKLFYEAVESAQNKPVRGGGLRRVPLQKIRFALWPQVKPLFLSYGFMRLEINFRSSTILGLVGAGGIGRADDQHQARPLRSGEHHPAADHSGGVGAGHAVRSSAPVGTGGKNERLAHATGSAASRRQHKQLYQVRGATCATSGWWRSLPALLRLVFLQFGISGEQLTTGLQQIGRYRRGCSSGTTSGTGRSAITLRKSASPPSSSPGR